MNGIFSKRRGCCFCFCFSSALVLLLCHQPKEEDEEGVTRRTVLVVWQWQSTRSKWSTDKAKSKDKASEFAGTHVSVSSGASVGRAELAHWHARQRVLLAAAASVAAVFCFKRLHQAPARSLPSRRYFEKTLRSHHHHHHHHFDDHQRPEESVQ